MINLKQHMPNYKKAIIENTDILSLIQEKYGIIRYSMRGNELNCSCPLPDGLHKNGDRSPSFSMNIDSGLWNCYVDGGGNIVQFVMRMDDVSYDDAINILRQYQNEITDEDFENLIAIYGVEQPKIINTVEQLYDNEVTSWSKNYHDYWKSRGFSQLSISTFKLGYDPVENRVVIPHYFGGKCVGYQKRTLDGTGPKWKNSEMFPRSTTIFNYDNAKAWSKEVIVVEAAASAIWLHQIGYPNVVATFGAKVTVEQSRLLRRFDKVTIWFDPDSAGQKGSHDLAENINRFTRCYIVQAGGDPNELNIDECKSAIENARPT